MRDEVRPRRRDAGKPHDVDQSLRRAVGHGRIADNLDHVYRLAQGPGCEVPRVGPIDSGLHVTEGVIEQRCARRQALRRKRAGNQRAERLRIQRQLQNQAAGHAQCRRYEIVVVVGQHIDADHAAQRLADKMHAIAIEVRRIVGAAVAIDIDDADRAGQREQIDCALAPGIADGQRVAQVEKCVEPRYVDQPVRARRESRVVDDIEVKSTLASRLEEYPGGIDQRVRLGQSMQGVIDRNDYETGIGERFGQRQHIGPVAGNAMRKNNHRPAAWRWRTDRLHPGRGRVGYGHYQRNPERGRCDRDRVETMHKIGRCGRRVEREGRAGPYRLDDGNVIGVRQAGYRIDCRCVAVVIDQKLTDVNVSIAARHRARRQHAECSQNRGQTSRHYPGTGEWSDHGALSHGLCCSRGHDIADRLGAEIGAGNNRCRVHPDRPRDRQVSADQLPQAILRGVGQGDAGKRRVAQPGIIGVRRCRASGDVGNAVRHQHQVRARRIERRQGPNLQGRRTRIEIRGEADTVVHARYQNPDHANGGRRGQVLDHLEHIDRNAANDGRRINRRAENLVEILGSRKTVEGV